VVQLRAADAADNGALIMRSLLICFRSQRNKAALVLAKVGVEDAVEARRGTWALAC
jgi:hypothetical protein